MDYQSVLSLLIFIVTIDFTLNKMLGHFNNESRWKPIPEKLKGIYDEEQYRKSQQYQSAVYNFGTLSSFISFGITLAMLWFGGFGWLDEQLRPYAIGAPVLSLYFFGVVFFASDIFSIPFQLYSTFVIEERFGFNKMNLKTFVLDKLKGWLLTLIVGGIIAAIFIAMVFFYQSAFWIYFWIVISVFFVFINMFYTTLIVPIFNKLSPLGDGALKSAITNYAQKVKFPLNNIFVIDGSKRSSKANAFFSGLGRKKKVVLYDTLIENHSEQELVSILAHEVGHFKKKHIVWSMILSILQTGLMLWLLSLMVSSSEISWALGGNVSALHLNVIAFGILYAPLSTVIGIVMNVLSRKNEYEADAFAVSTYDRNPLIAALKKLTADNLGNLTPHPWYVFVNYSHPTLLQRIEAMEKCRPSTMD